MSCILRSGLFLALVGAIAAAAPASASTLEEVSARGVLTMICFPHQDSEFVAVDISAGPMPKVGTSANFRGVDVDIMAAFASRLGVQLSIRPVEIPSYGELIPALLRGEGDLIASSLTITAHRQELVDFSAPYHSVHPVVVTRKKTKASKLEDLTGLKAATIPGSSQEELLLSLGFPADSLVHTSFTRDNYMAVAEGTADFTVVDTGTVASILPEFRTLTRAFEMPQGEDYAFALPKGSDLLEPLDAMLEEMRSSGLLDEIRRRHGVPIK